MDLFHLGLFGHAVPRIVAQVREPVNEYVTYESQGVVEKIVKPIPNCQRNRTVRDHAKVLI